MDSRGVDAGLLQSKYRLTKQRAAVLRALEDGEHLSAEAIHERVEQRLPGVSLGTVYRTLDILRQIGLVQTFSHNGTAARYEAVIEKHHHLVCSQCHELRNVTIPSVAETADRIAREHGYERVEGFFVIVGKCADCVRNGQAESEPREA